MSEFKNFARCVVCRSKKNMESYKGEFEVTMLLNTLYLTLMHLTEKRNTLHFKSSIVVTKLKDFCSIDTCENEFNGDDIMRYLRNALAHFNIRVSGDQNEKISTIQLWGINPKERPICKEPCANPLCIPKQFKERSVISSTTGEHAKAVCIFTFSTDGLKEFTEQIISYALSILPKDICSSCIYYRQENYLRHA